jgi:methylmalonyl-CoA epimerase
MLKKISHLGVAVKDLDAVLAFYTETLGLNCTGQEEVANQKVRVAFLPIGETNIELLQATEPDGPIAKFIESKGEGIHHVAFQVENIEQALADLKARGARLIDETPRIGAHGARIAFIHPKASNGVLIELCEHAE